MTIHRVAGASSLDPHNPLPPQVEHCLVYGNKDALSAEDTPWTDGRDRWYGEEVAKQDTKADVEWVDAEDPLFLL